VSDEALHVMINRIRSYELLLTITFDEQAVQYLGTPHPDGCCQVLVLSIRKYYATLFFSYTSVVYNERIVQPANASSRFIQSGFVYTDHDMWRTTPPEHRTRGNVEILFKSFETEFHSFRS
jgi:hypothetical protein